MSDPELEAFKTGIDLRHYAAANGYAWDRHDSSANWFVMRQPSSDDKILITLDKDGHYVYCSARDDADNGSIIDFIQHRQHLNLGQVRKELRPWINRHWAEPLPSLPALVKRTRDRRQVETAYLRMIDAPPLSYLEGVRGIPAALLQSPRFAGRIKTDARGNAVFPHFDDEGLCGYEIKNRGFTGFASGGQKGLWTSHGDAHDHCLIVAESAIEALSFAALHPDQHSRYGSISGKPSPQQPALITAEILSLPPGGEVIAAMNADDAGRHLVEVMRLAVEAAVRPDLRFTPALPERNGWDWNNVLRPNLAPCPL